MARPMITGIMSITCTGTQYHTVSIDKSCFSLNSCRDAAALLYISAGVQSGLSGCDYLRGSGRMEESEAVLGRSFKQMFEQAGYSSLTHPTAKAK